MTLLTVNNLKTYFSDGQNHEVKAVDNVSFEVEKGTTVGLVGESKSGKSTLAKSIVRLTRATAGDVYFEGTDILALSRNEFAPYRKRMQLIFQDSANSLNPRITVGGSVREAVDLHYPDLTKPERASEVDRLFEKVKLQPDSISLYPHELNSGERQRVGIARALAVEPKFIICDELVTGLDVSIQAQIVNLLQDLQQELGLTYLFTSPDIAVTQHISEHLLIMYRGRIVESGTASDVIETPKHEYTRKLLAAAPKLA